MASIRKNIREVARGISGSVGMPEFSLSKIDYNEYWEARGDSAGLQPRFPIMADLISEGARVLDVGCGDGTFLAYLEDRKSVDEKGVDISEVAVERAREKGVSAQVETLSHVAEENNEESFDHVVMSEVIEHIPSPEEFVLKAWMLTNESLIITFPNIGYWPHRLRLLLGRFPVQWAHHPGEHLRFWTIPDFPDWLEELDLSGEMTLSLYPSNGITILNFHKTWPNLFCNQVVVEIEKDG